MWIRFNLLSGEELVRLGFTEEEVSIIEEIRPLSSILDLLHTEGVDGIEAVRSLLSQGIVVGSSAELALLGPMMALQQDDGGAPPGQQQAGEDAPPGQQQQQNGDGQDDEEDEGGGTEDPTIWEDTERGIRIAGVAGATLTPIEDCTTSKTFNLTITRTKERPKLKGSPYPQAVTEEDARGSVRRKFGEAVGKIVQKCVCTDPDCLTQSLTITHLAINLIISRKYKRWDPIKGTHRGWTATAVGNSTVTVKCQ